MAENRIGQNDSTGDPAVTVIIPYFQRKPGILRRTLTSIFSQARAPSWEVIVVDDGSPAPAADEVRDLPAAQRDRIRIIPQPNGGPGNARNTGLDAVRDISKYIAFVDSDDEWFEHHLDDACYALEQGYDFYFADHYHLGRDESAFKRAGRLDLAAHPPLPGRDYLRDYRGDMINQIITGSVIGTSTVVFRRSRFVAVRFLTEFRSAGEDYLFWLTIAGTGAKFVFSSRCDTRYGHGVNVYSGAGWGTEEHLRRVHDEMRYRKVTSRHVPVTPALTRLLDQKIEELRVAFVGDLLHRLLRLKRVSMRLILKHAALDPMTFVRFLPISVEMLARRKQ